MACLKVWDVEVPLCTETVIIPTTLDDGDYKMVITDKFNNKYEREITVVYGFFSIDLTDLADVSITIYSKYTIQLFDGCELQTIGCDDEYDTIGMAFVTSDTEETEFTLCCN